jgi:hypothetical protein
MPDGNRYAAALQPQMGGPPPPQAGPPPGAPPQGPPQGAPPGPPQGQGAAPPNPALVEAFNVLSGHEGPIADLLKDPAKLPHVRLVFDAVKQDPVALQGLAKAGIGPDKLQQFEQMLAQAEQGGQPGGRDDTGRPVPHWLAR